MDIVVREEEGCKRILEINAPSSIVEGEMERLLNSYRSQVTFPGFRKGKAPLQIVKKKYWGTIQKEAIESSIPKIYREALQKKGLIPITQATIEKVDYQPPEFGFKATFEILPTPPVENYKGIPLVKRRKKIGTKEVEERLFKLRELNAVFKTVQREAREGDYLILDYKPVEEEGRVETDTGGRDPQARSKSGRTTNFALTLKKGEKFFEDLLGARPKETREIRGEGGEVFQVTVKEVKERELPEEDEELAKDLGARDLKDLNEKIEKDLEVEEEERVRVELERELIEELIRRTPFEVPVSVLEGVENRDLALFQAKRTILLNQVAEKEGIEVTEKEVQSALGRPEAGEEEKRRLRATLRREKTLHFLLDEALVDKEKDSFWGKWKKFKI
ncbi:hypothetical protein IIA15_11330 [candidate division TA06 bacterium]|nr:hypothetical protein [candidate division TA06 bacterium]